MFKIQTKRVYEKANRDDGYRVLVDRVWPRGVSKGELKADLWLKEAAPTTNLRKWFNHDQSKWKTFETRYFDELDSKPEAIETLLNKAEDGRLTLLYSARDTECNQAVALREYLLRRHKEEND